MNQDSAFSDERIYYSTPFGNTTDGQHKLFLLQRDGKHYLPVFRSEESMKNFYARAHRSTYAILEGDVKSILELNRSIELMRTVGIVIEPLSEHPSLINP